MSNPHVYENALDALQWAVDNAPTTPYTCRVRNKVGREFDAEITSVGRGYCCSAKVEQHDKETLHCAG